MVPIRFDPVLTKASMRKPYSQYSKPIVSQFALNMCATNGQITQYLLRQSISLFFLLERMYFKGSLIRDEVVLFFLNVHYPEVYLDGKRQ